MRPKASLSKMKAVIGDWVRCWQQAFDTWSQSVKKTVSAETPSISFRRKKIGYSKPFGKPFRTSARLLVGGWS
jgi:hypothetical protein